MLPLAWFSPNQPISVYPFPEPVPIKWVVTFAVAVSLVLGLLPGSDGVAPLAHLGGFATGFLCLKAADWRVARAERHVRRTAEPRMLVQSAHVARGSDAAAKPRRPQRDATQAEIDRGLHKISPKGIESLTPAQRPLLTQLSRQNPDQP